KPAMKARMTFQECRGGSDLLRPSGNDLHPERQMVGAIGFEPTTSWSQTRRSTRLSYTPMTDRHGTRPSLYCQYSHRFTFPRSDRAIGGPDPADLASWS